MRHLIPAGIENGRTNWLYRESGGDDTEGDPGEKRVRIHTLLLSDLHLGRVSTRAEAVIATLNTFWFDQIVLNGDIFENLDFTRLPKRHWKVLSRIRKLSAPNRGVTEAWVRGNHDIGIIEVMSHLVGVPVFDEYRWEHAGRSYLAIHGDQFDSTIGRSPAITRWLGAFHRPLRALDPGNRYILPWLLKRVAMWRRESALVLEGAVRHARKRGVQTVICGHTHEPADVMVGGIHYMNSGSWIENPCSFITVGDDGPQLNIVKLDPPYPPRFQDK